jgi:hypothetical protein
VKTKIKSLQKNIEKKKQELKKAELKEEKIRNNWTKKYGEYNTKIETLSKIKNHKTKRAQSLWKQVTAWPSTSPKMTQVRDAQRKVIQDIKNELVQLGLQLARLTEQEYSEVNATDEIVTGVLDLTKSVVAASTARQEFLNRHVFPRLIGKDGKLVSQVSFFSSNGLHKVVAMVNTMTLVVGDLAQKAQDEIEGFFKKFDNSHMDGPTKTMYELTKQILVEKINFKIGPHLYRFLSLELDEDIFPELALAQRYLRQSIRSEKTNSYIRIYSRKSRTDKFIPVPQS